MQSNALYVTLKYKTHIQTKKSSKRYTRKNQFYRKQRQLNSNNCTNRSALNFLSIKLFFSRSIINAWRRVTFQLKCTKNQKLFNLELHSWVGWTSAYRKTNFITVLLLKSGNCITLIKLIPISFCLPMVGVLYGQSSLRKIPFTNLSKS